MNQRIANTISEYFKTKPVNKAWVFGSFAREEERPGSDIDILIQFIPGAKMGFAYFGMICDLEERLSRNVDLVVEGNLLPFAKESANKDKVLVYERTN